MEVKPGYKQKWNLIAGARRLRRFIVRMVLDVRVSQAWWTLKRPEGRAPCTPRVDGHLKKMGAVWK